MKFTKMHGAGNDYVYVNGFDYESDWSKLSVFVSDRHTGIGSDGLIVALPSITADVRMRMFNADGSEGDMCGNGIRCLVAFGIEQNILSSNTDVKNIETKYFKVSKFEAQDFISQLNHDIQFPQIQSSGTTTIIPAKSIVEVRIEEDEPSLSQGKGKQATDMGSGKAS